MLCEVLEVNKRIKDLGQENVEMKCCSIIKKIFALIFQSRRFPLNSSYHTRRSFKLLSYLVWIAIYNWLFFKFKLAGVLATSIDAHCAIMVTVNFANYDIVNGSSHFTPLKCFSIIKLEGKNAYWVKLNGSTPELPSQIGITPESPTSTVTVACNNHWVMTDLK